MFLRLLVFIFAFFVLELVLLVRVGAEIGVLATLAIVIGTAIVGSSVARAQGLRVIEEARRTMNRGEIPSAEIFDGVLVSAGGLLLLAPGLIGDVVGLALLVPPIRAKLGRRLGAFLRGRFVVTSFRPGAGRAGREADDEVIDVEAIDEDERDDERG